MKKAKIFVDYETLRWYSEAAIKAAIVEFLSAGTDVEIISHAEASFISGDHAVSFFKDHHRDHVVFDSDGDLKNIIQAIRRAGSLGPIWMIDKESSRFDNVVLLRV